MPNPKPPSSIQPIPVPVFALSWHTTPSLAPTHIYACSGGGGSSKTGIGNFIQVVIKSNPSEDGDGSDEETLKIDTGNDIGVSLDIMSFPFNQSDKAAKVVLVAGIEDDVRLYEFSLSSSGQCTSAPQLVASLTLEKGYIVNTVSFDPVGSHVAVGGEMGNVTLCAIVSTPSTSTVDDVNAESAKAEIQILKMLELIGHQKGICKVSFHPTNPSILLSSAKDGTCRVWDLKKASAAKQSQPAKDDTNTSTPTGPESTNTSTDPDHEIHTNDGCLDILNCKIYDPNDLAKKKPIPKKILNPNIGQLLVKGAVFGDLQGRFIYTIQSGRRGSAFLSVWRVVMKQVGSANQEKQQQQQPPRPPQPKQITFQEQSRIKISDFPVSSMSLSGDYKTLSLGDTNGNLILYNTDTFKETKNWKEIHDLPVTCVAARPLPVPLAGDQKTGIAIDAICASADSKICFLTTQRKSTLKKPRKTRSSSGGGISSGSCWLTLLFVLFILSYSIKVSYDVCYEDHASELSSWDELQNGFLHCVIHTVWWAEHDRPGVAFVPQ